MREGGGNCLKYLKGRRGTEKRGGDTKILKRGPSWVKGWLPCKKRGDWTEPPYELWLTNVIFSETLWRDKLNILVK